MGLYHTFALYHSFSTASKELLPDAEHIFHCWQSKDLQIDMLVQLFSYISFLFYYAYFLYFFFTVTLIFTTSVPLLTVITVFPAFKALIFPFLLTFATSLSEDLNVIFSCEVNGVSSVFIGSLTLRLPLDFHNSLHHSPLRLIFLSNFKILLVIVCHCVV